MSHVGGKAPISLHQSHLYWYTYNELWLDETKMNLKAYYTMELDHDVHINESFKLIIRVSYNKMTLSEFDFEAATKMLLT